MSNTDMKSLLLVFLQAVIILAKRTINKDGLSAHSNAFAIDVYKELTKTVIGNFLVCPISAQIVLTLVYFGAGGKTAEQLAKGLSLPTKKKMIERGIQRLVSIIAEDDKNYTLFNANKIYVKKGYEIKHDFKTMAVQNFDAEIQNIDFDNEKYAASKINKWVNVHTGRKIKNVISKDDLNEDTRSLVISAMYFRGKWTKPFQKYATSKKTFYVDGENQVKVDMMQQRNYFLYKEDWKLNCKVLVLPYDQNNNVAIWFILPNDKEGLTTVEAQITQNRDLLSSCSSGLNLENVQVTIPKFKAETIVEFDPVLKMLGVADAFNEAYANFTGIVVNEKLVINKVVQKTYINVDEKGTEAAAATCVNMKRVRSAFVDTIRSKEFLADHPFIYFIQIENIIFFIGRYISP